MIIVTRGTGSKKDEIRKFEIISTVSSSPNIFERIVKSGNADGDWGNIGGREICSVNSPCGEIITVEESISLLGFEPVSGTKNEVEVL